MLTAQVHVNGRRIALLKVRNTTGAGDSPVADYAVELTLTDDSNVAPGQTFRGQLRGFERKGGGVALVQAALDAVASSRG